MNIINVILPTKCGQGVRLLHVKVRILYSRILLDQKSSGLRPDWTTKKLQLLAAFLFPLPFCFLTLLLCRIGYFPHKKDGISGHFPYHIKKLVVYIEYQRIVRSY